MNKHQNFLRFNGTNITFISVDGSYYIALSPICKALKLDADRVVKTTKNDPFFGACTSFQTVQVSKNGKKQGRKVTCMSEKYIYGWICFLRSDSPELLKYKKTCYELLYNHFHGTITNRKELLVERDTIDAQIGELKLLLKEDDEQYKELTTLQSKRKLLSTQLNTIDKELVKQPSLFDKTMAN